jgi:catechol 2,3-dioxygenase-like lactoylglutathione lyase family enzyme
MFPSAEYGHCHVRRPRRPREDAPLDHSITSSARASSVGGTVRPSVFYCVGARTAIGIQPAGPAHNGDRFLQSRVGLHHLCLRARSREDVDRLHDLLRQMGAIIIHGPQEGTWAPGYYSVLFEDPDGIRLEANFVPGAGVLQPDVKFNPAEGYST